MSELSFEMVRKTVREMADERPDFVYDRGSSRFCKYNPDDEQPGCLFGQAFIRLGHPVPEDREKSPITLVMSGLGVEATPEEKHWAYAVQAFQDNGDPWGEAVRKADEIVSLD